MQVQICILIPLPVVSPLPAYINCAAGTIYPGAKLGLHRDVSAQVNAYLNLKKSGSAGLRPRPLKNNIKLKKRQNIKQQKNQTHTHTKKLNHTKNPPNTRKTKKTSQTSKFQQNP